MVKDEIKKKINFKKDTKHLPSQPTKLMTWVIRSNNLIECKPK